MMIEDDQKQNQNLNQEEKSTERRQDKSKYDSKRHTQQAPVKHENSDIDSEPENLIDINDLQEGIQADDEDNDIIETERNYVKNKRNNLSSSVHYYGDIEH